MRTVPIVAALLLLAACGGVKSYDRGIAAPIPDAYACATRSLRTLGYEFTLQDSVGALVQGRREITGLVETARKGAAAATGLITVGLAGGKRTRFDEITVFVYMRHYPQGNAFEATAGLLTTAGDVEQRSAPTDDAKRDARRLLATCAPRR